MFEMNSKSVEDGVSSPLRTKFHIIGRVMIFLSIKFVFCCKNLPLLKFLLSEINFCALGISHKCFFYYLVQITGNLAGFE